MRKWNKKDLKWQKKKENEQKRAKQQETVLELSTENMLRDCEFDPRACSFLTESVIKTIKMGIKPSATPQQIEDSQRFLNSLTDFEKSYVTLFVKTKKEETRLKLLFPGLKVLKASATLQRGVTPQTLEISSPISFFGPGPNTSSNTQTRTLSHFNRGGVRMPSFNSDRVYLSSLERVQPFPISFGTVIETILEQEIVDTMQTTVIQNPPTNPSRFYATEDVYILEDNITNYVRPRVSYILPDWSVNRVSGRDLVSGSYNEMNRIQMSLQEYQGNNVVRPDYNRGVLTLPPTITTNPCELIRGVIGAYTPFNVMREEVQDTEEECVLCGCELKGVVLKCTQCNNRVHWGGMERYKVMKCPFCRLEFIN